MQGDDTTNKLNDSKILQSTIKQTLPQPSPKQREVNTFNQVSYHLKMYL